MYLARIESKRLFGSRWQLYRRSPDNPGTNETDQIVRRLKHLREPHRSHAIKRIEHMHETVEEHQAEFAGRVNDPAERS